jgi:iron complex outermembrane recepter protein
MRIALYPLQGLLVLSLVALCIGGAQRVWANESEESVDLVIPAQSLKTALVLFSQQTHIQVVADAQQIDNAHSEGVNGRIPAKDGLARLLAGTSFTYRLVGETTVVIVNLPALKNPAADTSSGRRTAVAKPSADDVISSNLNTVVVTGTRELNRKARDSISPINVISAAALQATGATDLRDALDRLLPSLTYQSQANDLGALTNSVQLLGLSPDQVLVLVNGKRRHTTANLYADNGPLQGSAPVDLDLIPISAIGHIEVLRDGAAAQYGSDAIAGVINIILKSSNRGGAVIGDTGQYYKSDGYSVGAAEDSGLRLGDNGFLHVSAEFRHDNHTVRSGPDSSTGIVDDLIFGNPAVGRELVAFNSAYTLDEVVELYAFGTFGHRDAKAYENYRLPDIAPSVYPNGFSPQEMIDEEDFSMTAGMRGDLAAWHYDLSTTYGGDHDAFGLTESINTTLLVPNPLTGTDGSPTSFHIASFGLLQWTNNLDISRLLEIGLPTPLNAAFGAEYRHESYEVGSGDISSYYDGGAQGFQGLNPGNTGLYLRNNHAAYLDLAQNLTSRWQLDLAGRYEYYTDFGDTLNGKLSMRYDFNSRLALRATLSNGFRAPSLPQEHFSDLNVTPTGASGQLAANSPAAAILGARNLRPEKSTNFSIGGVGEPFRDLHITLDAYQIDIRNRIIDGGNYTGAVALSALAANGITLPSGLDTADVSARYFSNGIDTLTQGFDFTADYRSDFGRWGVIDWDLGLNLNRTRLTRLGLDGNGNPLLNAQGIGVYTSETPRSKIIAGGVWRNNEWDVILHEKRYGTSSGEDTYEAGPDIFSTTVFYHSVDPPRYLTDLEVGYQFTARFRWALGANNLLNAYPKGLPADVRYLGAPQYDEFTGAGINGGYYYTRLTYKF